MTVWAHESGAHGAVLPDGRRRHFQHGPIDLILDADGADRDAAFDRAWAAFVDVLPALVEELPLLRAPVGPSLNGPVAHRMRAAALPHGEIFVTPMAAVAGAVADHVLAAMTEDGALERAYVNNGGDIALHLAPGQVYRTGMVFDHDAPALDGFAEIHADLPVRGIATSGWRGRSHSLGIADSVTVLARTAAEADVAATLIANAVYCDHPAIERAPAADLAPDSDLGERMVTTAVGALPDDLVGEALGAGATAAEAMRAAGLIETALLTCKGQTRSLGGLPARLAA